MERSAGIRYLAGGESHSCAVFDGGELRCWRRGPAIRRGGACLPETHHLLDPLEPAEEVTIDFERTCVRARSGRTRCIGLTRDTPFWEEGACRPALVVDPEGRPLELARAEVGIGLDPSGDVWVWSDKPTASGGFVARRLSLGPRRFIDVAASGPAVCLLSHDGEVWCWTDPSLYDHAGLVASDVRRVAAGVGAIGCGQRWDGGPWCCFASSAKLWCQPLSTDDNRVAAAAEPLPRVVEISVGWGFVCVRLEDGEARCFDGRLGEWWDFVHDEPIAAREPGRARTGRCTVDLPGLER